MDLIYTDEKTELRTGMAYTWHGKIDSWPKQPGKNSSNKTTISRGKSIDLGTKTNAAAAGKTVSTLRWTGRMSTPVLRTRYAGMKTIACSIALRVITRGIQILLRVMLGLNKRILDASSALIRSYPQAPAPSRLQRSEQLMNNSKKGW